MAHEPPEPFTNLMQARTGVIAQANDAHTHAPANLGSHPTPTPRSRVRLVQPLIDARTLKGELDWIVMKAMDKDRARPKTRAQRCWVHKAKKVVGKLPKRRHGRADDLRRRIWMAPTKATASTASTALDLFITTYQPKYAAAAECLSKDREVLLAFLKFDMTFVPPPP